MSVRRLDCQPFPSARHVHQNSLHGCVGRPLGHLPTFGGSVATLCRRNHRCYPPEKPPSTVTQEDPVGSASVHSVATLVLDLRSVAPAYHPSHRAHGLADVVALLQDRTAVKKPTIAAAVEVGPCSDCIEWRPQLRPCQSKPGASDGLWGTWLQTVRGGDDSRRLVIPNHRLDTSSSNGQDMMGTAQCGRPANVC